MAELVTFMIFTGIILLINAFPLFEWKRRPKESITLDIGKHFSEVHAIYNIAKKFVHRLSANHKHIIDLAHY